MFYYVLIGFASLTANSGVVLALFCINFDSYKRQFSFAYETILQFCTETMGAFPRYPLLYANFFIWPGNISTL